MSDETQRPLGTLITAAVLAVASSWLAIRMPAVIASFHEMFGAIGTELPNPTRLILVTPYAWWVFPAAAVPLLVWVIRHERAPREELGRIKVLLRVLLALTALAYAFAAYALYLPIFRLGAVV